MVEFWSTRGPYGCFSNFSKHPVVVFGKTYPTTEHLYQALKMDNDLMHEQVRLARTPKIAKLLAHTFAEYYKPNWEKIKYETMKGCLLEKALQHPNVTKTLLSTRDETIVEASPYDYVWGIGKDKTGKNLLGKCWMEVRAIVHKMIPQPEHSTLDEFMS